MHILIIRVSAIGDVIHTLPSLFLLKHQFPQAKIHWVVQKKAADLLVGQPFLDNVWVLPDKFLHPKNWRQTFQTLKELRKYTWDAIIDFQGLLKTGILTIPLHGKKYGFSAPHTRERLSALLTHHHDTPTYTNIVQKNLSLASAVAFHQGSKTSSPTSINLQKNFELTVPEDKQKQVDYWLEDNHVTHPLLLCPNTTWASKHWPEEYWVTLTKLLREVEEGLSSGATWAADETASIKNSPKAFPLEKPPKSPSKYPTPILVGTAFGQAAKNIATLCAKQNLHPLICPAWDLLTMSYLIKKSSLVIAPDTGLLHLADFLGTPALGLFGPTDKKRSGPFWSIVNQNLTVQTPTADMSVFTPQQLLAKVLNYLEQKKNL